MALIEYDIQKNGTVTYRVLEVDAGDRIQYSSKDANAAIEFQGAPPFKGQGAPAAGQIIHVGNGKKGPFAVDKKLTDANKVQFECGDHKEGDAAPLKSWGNGGFIPPGLNSGGSTGL